MRVLELFSGIGGMHFALQESGINGEVVAAIDINTVANKVYKHNFPSTKLYQKNIQSFSVEELNKMSPDAIFMSPPCQPFTRVGLKKDVQDERTCALLHIIHVLPKLNNKLRYVLLENVRGFEKSEAREKLIKCLRSIGFVCQEFILCPTLIGIPNSRSRYYLIAKRLPRQFSFPVSSDVMEIFPDIIDQLSMNEYASTSRTLAEVIEFHDNIGSPEYQELLVPDNILAKRVRLMDIVCKDYKRSCCFTKAYGHYVEGTGSIYCPFTQETVSVTNNNFENEFFDKIKDLNLRYFSPFEIAKLMNFPTKFNFPNDINRKQKYRLLGNSINIRVVSLLIKIMLHDDDLNL